MVLSLPLSRAMPHARELIARQDTFEGELTTDAASLASVSSAQEAVFGSFDGNEVTSSQTTTVPIEQIYLECPDGSDWSEVTTHNGDLGKSADGQACLASYTGTFTKAWYMGAITDTAGVYGCQLWDTNTTTWHWAYSPSQQIRQILCMWDDLGGLGEHTVRILNPPLGYAGGGELWVNGLIHATDDQTYTTKTGTVVATHSAPVLTSGVTAFKISASSSDSTTAASAPSAAASASATAATPATTGSASSPASSPSSPAASAAPSPTNSSVNTNQILLIIAVYCIIFFALIMVYCLVCRRKPPSATKEDSGPVAYVREGSLGKRAGRRRNVVDSGSESGTGSEGEWSDGSERGGWPRRNGELNEQRERRKMLR